MSRGLYWALLALIVAGALALRLPKLGERPMHNDEGVNTIKFNELWQTGRFAYDPNEYHGPTLYYLTAPVVWLSGASGFAQTTEVQYRLVAVVFGVGLILLLPLVADGIGRGGVLWAALFTAVSPAMVFYSRYYIHEMPLIFFAFAAVACGWRYRRSNRLGWAAAAGAMVGLTYATKETWVLGLSAAAGAAIAAATIWHVLLKGPGHRIHLRSKALAVAAVAFAIVFFTLFSDFFRQPTKPWEAITSYFHYTQRASGSDHDHPWYHYLRILTYYKVGKTGPVWTEVWIVALAVVGFLLAVFRRHHVANHGHHAPAATPHHQPFAAYPPFVRFLGFYTLLLTAAFSIIPYKTPWCLLGFLQGMILLAGFACGQIVHAMPWRALKGVMILAGLAAAGHLAMLADRATTNWLDPKRAALYFRTNPYVYGHTSPVFLRLVDRVHELMPFTRDGERSVIAIVGRDYWPLPFYLRRYPNVGYFAEPPGRVNMPVVISSLELEEAVAAGAEAASAEYFAEFHQLRPGVLLVIRVERAAWDRFLASRK